MLEESWKSVKLLLVEEDKDNQPFIGSLSPADVMCGH